MPLPNLDPDRCWYSSITRNGELSEIYLDYDDGSGHLLAARTFLHPAVRQLDGEWESVTRDEAHALITTARGKPYADDAMTGLEHRVRLQLA